MQKRLAAAALLWLNTTVVFSLAWADDSPTRSTPGSGGAGNPIQLGKPTVRLGKPSVRKESGGDIVPTAFLPDHLASKPLPYPDAPKADGKAEDKATPKSEAIPAPAPVPAPGTDAIMAAPPGIVGWPAQPVMVGDGQVSTFTGELPPDCCGANGTCVGGECLPMGCMIEGPHGPMSKVYLNLEFLAWSLKSDQVPALVTTSNQDDLGILGRPSTQVLVGGDIDLPVAFGGRINLGVWFDRCERFGMMGSVFLLQEQEKTYTFGSNGDPLYARPFFNPNGGGFEDSQLVAAIENPNLPDARQLRGTVDVDARTRLMGADLNFRWNILHCLKEKNCNLKAIHVDFIAGAKFVRLEDDLTITENLGVGLIGGPVEERFLVQDQFSTVNNFYGGQVGLLAEMRYKRWFLNFTGKVGIGATQAEVEINGLTSRTLVGGPTETRAGGLLAGPFNSGTHRQTAFSIVPEVGVNVGYQLTDHLRIYVGYNLLVWTNVTRPGNVIDRTVNPRYLPFYAEPDARTGPRRPSFEFRDSTFWAQGVIAGLEWRF